MSDDLRPGTVLLGKYAIVKLIGRGGMAAVYEVEHAITKRRCALKLLHSTHQRADVVERFLREASAAGRIGNDHIVETLDAGTLESGEPYLVMELLQGESLAERLTKQRMLPIGELAEIVRQACDAVAAAHGAGIVHRDLKPDNLYLSRRRDALFVKVLDFGISKFDERKTGVSGMTQDGAFLGTPYYMAPEQIRGNDVDELADVYALGVILYEGASGRRPFDADTLTALSILIHEGRATPLAQLRPDLPPGFADVVAGAMNPSRANRIRTAADLARALSPFAGTSGERVGPPSLGLAATAAALAPTFTGPPPPFAGGPSNPPQPFVTGPPAPFSRAPTHAAPPALAAAKQRDRRVMSTLAIVVSLICAVTLIASAYLGIRHLAHGVRHAHGEAEPRQAVPCTSSRDCPGAQRCMADHVCARPLRVAFLYEGQPNAESSHDEARRALAAAYPWLETDVVPDLKTAEDVRRTIASYVRHDYELFVTTSPALLPAMVVNSKRFPDSPVRYLGPATDTAGFPRTVHAYDASAGAAWYVAGSVAVQASGHKLGFVVSSMTAETIADVNAFARGALSARPDVVVELRVLGSAGDEEAAARELVDADARVIASDVSSDRIVAWMERLATERPPTKKTPLRFSIGHQSAAACTAAKTTCIGHVRVDWSAVVAPHVEALHRRAWDDPIPRPTNAASFVPTPALLVPPIIADANGTAAELERGGPKSAHLRELEPCVFLSNVLSAGKTPSAPATCGKPAAPAP